MRIWSIHPQYLDSQGLVALWRESLLARAVLRGETRGYRHHPQLHRFQAQAGPCSAINAYLRSVLEEAECRGYRFDRQKVGPVRGPVGIDVNSGQIDYEWQHLLGKLQVRSPDIFLRWQDVKTPEAHPLFTIKPGPIEPWERTLSASRTDRFSRDAARGT